jgi:hypothetical protein
MVINNRNSKKNKNSKMKKNKTKKHKSKKYKSRYNNIKINNKYNLTKEGEKELEILRNAVDIAEKIKSKKVIKSPEIKKIISIVENFIRNKKLICYGCIAINNLLPEKDRFYNFDIELPDYDFYSSTALNDAKELADIYAEEGYEDVEAKAGLHFGTYKVFVNYIPVADITQMDNKLFENIKKDSIEINEILYCPVNFLKMSMYLELSSPKGDVSRWEKVLKRLILLNKNYPLIGEKCNTNTFSTKISETEVKNINIKIYNIVKDVLIKNGVVFFGGFAYDLYNNYNKSKYKKYLLNTIPDFDIISINPEKLIYSLKYTLIANNYNNIKIKTHSGIGELIPSHYEFIINDKPFIYIYKPLRCHSYNIYKLYNENIKIATIDTMLSFYLSFIYSGKEYYNVDKILCMAEYLFKIQSENKFKQNGILKRFSVSCYGKQKTREEMLEEKAIKYEKLKKNDKTIEYQRWFLKYIPSRSIKNLKYKKKNKILSEKNFVTKTIYERKNKDKIKKNIKPYNTISNSINNNTTSNNISIKNIKRKNINRNGNLYNKQKNINQFISKPELFNGLRKIGVIEY